MAPKIHLHHGDLPKNLVLGDIVAVDTEAMGLYPHRDRLCLVQLSSGNGECHLVKIALGQDEAPQLGKLLEDTSVIKIFHFARFDVATLWQNLGIQTVNIYCTKIASKLGRTFTDRHGLKDLCRDLLGIEISKHQRLTDWGADEYTPEQLTYAATDVLYLHRLKEILDDLLKRENRDELAEFCFDFIPIRAHMDLIGFDGWDVFEH